MKKSDVLTVLQTAKDGFVSRTVDAVEVPFLQGKRLPITFFAQDIDLNLAAEAIVNFCAASSRWRATVQDRLFIAAQQSFEDCDCDFASPQHQLDFEAENTGRFAGAKVPMCSEEIWSLVDFASLHIEPSLRTRPGQYAVKVTGDCAWDGEHGVAVVFDQTGGFVGVQ